MKAVIYDTETNGLVSNRTLRLDQQPSIIEFYAALVNLKTGNVLKELDLLIKPPQPLPDVPKFGDKKTISEMTGITNDMLKNAPNFKQVHGQIFSMLTKAPLIIAHNASFDRDMIEIEAQRLGVELAWPRIICTVEQTVALKGHRLTLSHLHQELFGEPFEGAHRAKPDTQALIRCACEMFKRGMI